MVRGARERVVTGEDAFGDGASAEVLGRELRSHAKELAEEPAGPLFFGRLDFDEAPTGEHRGQSYHIGRRRIAPHPAAPPLVIDWRAPVSRAFYQAGPRDPHGVAVRRRFGWAPGSDGDSRDLTGLEDEHLGRPAPRAAGDGPSRIVAGEIARHPVRATDTDAAAAIKHDPRMATVLARALYGRVALPTEPLAVPDGSYRRRVPLDELTRLVAEVREQQPPYAVGRERVRSRAVALLQREAERRAGPPDNAWLRRMGRARALTEFVNTVWPAVRPEEVVASLLADPRALAEAADGLLTAEEQSALLWHKPPRSYRSATWSAADLVLLDEVAGLVERPAGYGHIVVDEAQDLSPMQCRVIARRAGFGSLTVLGDLAQGTTPWAARDWDRQLAHLGKPQAKVVALTTGFRVPAAVVTLANRLLGALDVDVPETTSLRRDGRLRVREVARPAEAAAAAVRDALTHEGSVAVVAAGPDVPRVSRALEEAGIATAAADEAGGAVRVTVLPATLAKGLEYDHVVVVEPAAIAEAEPRGLHRLYVVLTRAVSRLDVLHHRPLPEALAGVRGAPVPIG
ncbi:AAA family ATPase [Streptomyces sparsogenes]|uniref:HelD family protein n=1 Tax=Streptomyces sparsogenes TaxID=67365 RepID=UPI0034022C3E